MCLTRVEVPSVFFIRHGGRRHQTSAEEAVVELRPLRTKNQMFLSSVSGSNDRRCDTSSDALGGRWRLCMTGEHSDAARLAVPMPRLGLAICLGLRVYGFRGLGFFYLAQTSPRTNKNPQKPLNSLKR